MVTLFLTRSGFHAAPDVGRVPTGTSRVVRPRRAATFAAPVGSEAAPVLGFCGSDATFVALLLSVPEGEGPGVGGQRLEVGGVIGTSFGGWRQVSRFAKTGHFISDRCSPRRCAPSRGDQARCERDSRASVGYSGSRQFWLLSLVVLESKIFSLGYANWFPTAAPGPPQLEREGRIRPATRTLGGMPLYALSQVEEIRKADTACREAGERNRFRTETFFLWKPLLNPHMPGWHHSSSRASVFLDK